MGRVGFIAMVYRRHEVKTRHLVKDAHTHIIMNSLSHTHTNTNKKLTNKQTKTNKQTHTHIQTNTHIHTHTHTHYTVTVANLKMRHIFKCK